MPAFAGMSGKGKCDALAPRHAVTREDLAHGFDQLVLGDRELRGAALAPLLVRGNRSCSLGAFNEILDLNLAFRLLVAALNDHARRTTLVRVFELRAHFPGAEIKLGADAGV